jgi:hypothetical protein
LIKQLFQEKNPVPLRTGFFVPLLEKDFEGAFGSQTRCQICSLVTGHKFSLLVGSN